MNILYLSCHSILEENELKIFHALGHEVFSLNGAYQNPGQPGDPKRPSLDIPFNQHLNDIALQCSKDDIHPELLEWADVVITMHRLDWLEKNWVKIRQHNVVPVWRSIGQSMFDWEKRAARLVPEGLKIVRYSPREINIPNYAGSDAIIRFGVDPNEFDNWNGESEKVHVFGQSVKVRGDFLAYDSIEESTKGFDRVMYGPGNEDIDWSRGVLSFDELKQAYKNTRCAFYTGTIPASYTLTFIEMMMTGTPLVCIGKDLFNCDRFFKGQDTYEIPDIIKNEINGFVGDNVIELRAAIKKLLSNKDFATQVSQNARKTALELFDIKDTTLGWKVFLEHARI